MAHAGKHTAVNYLEQQMTNTIAAGPEHTFMKSDISFQPGLVGAAPLHRHDGLAKSGKIFDRGRSAARAASSGSTIRRVSNSS